LFVFVIVIVIELKAFILGKESLVVC